MQLVKELIARAMTVLRALTPESTDEQRFEAQKEVLDCAFYEWNLNGEGPQANRRAMSFYLGVARLLRQLEIPLHPKALQEAVRTALVFGHPQLAWWLATGYGPILTHEQRVDAFTAALRLKQEYQPGEVALNFSYWRSAYQTLTYKEAPASADVRWEIRSDVVYALGHGSGNAQVLCTELYMDLSTLYNSIVVLGCWSPEMRKQLIYELACDARPEEMVAVYEQLNEDGRRELRNLLYELEREVAPSHLPNVIELQRQLVDARIDHDQLREWRDALLAYPGHWVRDLLRALPVEPTPAMRVLDTLEERLSWLDSNEPGADYWAIEPDSETVAALEEALAFLREESEHDDGL